MRIMKIYAVIFLITILCASIFVITNSAMTKQDNNHTIFLPNNNSASVKKNNIN